MAEATQEELIKKVKEVVIEKLSHGWVVNYEDITVVDENGHDMPDLPRYRIHRVFEANLDGDDQCTKEEKQEAFIQHVAHTAIEAVKELIVSDYTENVLVIRLYNIDIISGASSTPGVTKYKLWWFVDFAV
jgi:hypothetical protein